MAIRNIRKEGDEILKKKSREVEVIDDKVRELIEDMIETMHKYDGVGLAAVQVGILKQIIAGDQIQSEIKNGAKNGYAATLWNRRRAMPELQSSNFIQRAAGERAAMNMPIQGSAADIIKVAMINIYKRFKEASLKSTMILQVHDELNFNVYPDEKDIVLGIVTDEMQNAIALSVPLIADYGWGVNWLEAH